MSPMSETNEMSELQIAAKLKAGKPFIVNTAREQKRVLMGAKFLGVKVITRAFATAGVWQVWFVK